MAKFSPCVASCFLCLISLLGCGQRSSLFIPTEEEARNRSTLPQILIPALPAPNTQDKASVAAPPLINKQPSNSAPPASQATVAPK